MDIREMRQKADSGSCVAQTILGACYLDGIDIEVDYEEAFRLLSKAASQGASRAVLNLARMHAGGLGIDRNVLEAIRLYKTVANVEFLAPVELGRIYSRGLGVPSDPEEALKWYTAAAASKIVGDCEELREAKAYVAGET
jgi:TPR repeat protein